MSPWSPSIWRNRPAVQMPAYADREALAAAEARLAVAAPVAAPADSARLRAAVAQAVAGGGFILQGGDCAESFDDAVGERVASLAALFDAMAESLAPALDGPLVEIARIAGQFAKPRTSEWEMAGDLRLPAYRGDIINGAALDPAERRADPRRMLRAHLQSVGSAASLAAARGHERPIYTSHEALLLPYEEALSRRDEAGRWWATSGHMLWLGDRTRQVDGAHAAYLSGIENVVGVKCGPTLDPDELVRLADRLDPDRRVGKLLLIGRFGAALIDQLLPPLLDACRREGILAAWMIDPMHGNSRREGARKVRRLPDIMAETERFFAICADRGVWPTGIHLEMSALDVTECLGGRGPALIEDLDLNWQSACDPRLNRAQAIDLATDVARLLGAARPALASTA